MAPTISSTPARPAVAQAVQAFTSGNGVLKRKHSASWPVDNCSQSSDDGVALKSALNMVRYDEVQAAIMDPSEWNCRVCETTKSLWICLVCGHFLCHERILSHNQRVRRSSRHKQRRPSITTTTEEPISMPIPLPLPPLSPPSETTEDDVILTHLQAHVRDHKHPIYMELNTTEHQVYCFDSESVVEQDNGKRDFYLLRALLRQIQDLEDDDPTAPQRRRCDLRTAASRWHALRHSTALTFHLAYFSPSARQRRHRKDQIFTACFKWRHLLLLRCFNSWKMDVEEQKMERKKRQVVVDTSSVVMTEVGIIRTPRRRREGAIWPGKTGLRNLGNTCYLNSVLQALGHLPAFRSYLSSATSSGPTKRCEQNKSSSSSSSLLYELESVLSKLWSSKHAAFSPDTLVKTVWDSFPTLAGFKQQDSDELLRFLLTRFQEEEENTTTGTVNELFQGCIASEIQCTVCLHTSRTEQPFLGIVSVEIPISIRQPLLSSPVRSMTMIRRQSRSSGPLSVCSLEQCLDEVFATETLSGDAQYHCEQCQCKQDATKCISLAATPEIVVVHVNRTDWTTETNKSRKLQHIVHFPSQIPFPSNVKPPRPYLLRALIVHDGRSMTQGHYTCFAWHEELVCWFHFNDHRVSMVTWDDVSSQQAYLLFYTRQ